LRREPFKPWITTQRRKHRIAFEYAVRTKAGVVGALEPFNRECVVAEHGVDRRQFGK
jgi:hypothetical protein